jgi:hypothetical protein
MSDLIDTIKETREITADIFAKSLVDVKGNSEVEIREKILLEIKNHSEIFSEGWYNPPSSGIAVLLDKRPFERLEYTSLRDSDFWPQKDLRFEEESIGMIFFSPVNRKTNMIGDIGFTLYTGNNKEIKKHIKKSYETIFQIAKNAQVSMTFSELCSFADNLLKDHFKIVKWVTRNSDPKGMNFGHTIPGSYEKINFGKSFEEVKNTITKGRIYIKETENFKIPETCAFTVESRLKDINKPHLPSVYFHFIVCFNKGKKTILENFSEIFKTVGMGYMNKN